MQKAHCLNSHHGNTMADNLDNFLETLISSGSDGPQKKKSKPNPEKEMGYLELNRLEHTARLLQKCITTIIEEAPNSREIEDAANKGSEDFKKEAIQGNSLVQMVATLKSLYEQHKLPLFDEILQVKLSGETVAGIGTARKEAPKETKPSSKHQKGLPKLPEINDPQLRRRVFQHKSMASNKTYLDDDEIVLSHNERLEFLGDSVLNMLTTLILYKRFPYAKEGFLSRMRSELVCNKNLAELSVAYGFPYQLQCTIEEALLNQGRQKVHADIFEAYIGALAVERVYDLAEVEQWLALLMKEQLKKMAIEMKKEGKLNKEAKTELYLLIGCAKSHPQYKTVSTGNGGGSKFKVQCIMEGEILGVGESSSQREAGIRAAMAALENSKMLEKFGKKRQETEMAITKVSDKPQVLVKPTSSVKLPLVADSLVLPNKFSKNELYAFLGKTLGLLPDYDVLSKLDPTVYTVRLTLNNIVIAVATDSLKKNAMSRAAAIVLENKHLLDEILQVVQ